MSQRDDSVPLRHMLEHARESCALVSGRARDELRSNRILWDTVLDDFPPLVAALEQVLTDLD
jgi:hypothetical protein